MRHTFSILLVAALVTASATSDAATRRGRVALDGRALRDDNGHFLGLGASYFPALNLAKHDRDRFRSDLKFLSDRGFNYVRTLSMVGWYPAWKGKEIAPVPFTNKDGDAIAAWDDYWRQLADMIDIAFDDFQIRTQLTIFADAQLMPDKADRLAHLDKVLATVRGREHKVILLEVANEAWQNGFPGWQGVADLREFGKYLADRTDVLVALSATEGQDNEALKRMYVGSAADIATEHFSRDRRSAEVGWLPVRDVYRVNLIEGLPPASANEPIGPGSSVAGEDDPLKLVCAAAYAWMSGLPMYVFHSRAGVSGEKRFGEMAGAGDFQFVLRALPGDIGNWRRTEGRDDFAPFVTFADGQPDKAWTEVANAKSGALRHLSCVEGDAFYTLPIGILSGGVELQARRAMEIEILHPIKGHIRRATLAAHERMPLPQGDGAYVIRGRFTD